MQPNIEVRTLRTADDCSFVGNLTAVAFAEEVRGAGLTAAQWTDLETKELARHPWLWSHIGLATEGEKILGVVVLKFGNDKEEHLSYIQLAQRIGLLPTFWHFWYDQVLEEPLQPGECLVEFIAVSAEARGKGVGALLMQWAEQQAVSVILKEEPDILSAKKGVLMKLWVAEDNPVAIRLYNRCGYALTKKTSDDWGAFCMFYALKSLLGHAVWNRMTKLVTAENAPDPKEAPRMQGIISMRTVSGRVRHDMLGAEGKEIQIQATAGTHQLIINAAPLDTAPVLARMSSQIGAIPVVAVPSTSESAKQSNFPGDPLAMDQLGSVQLGQKGDKTAWSHRVGGQNPGTQQTIPTTVYANPDSTAEQVSSTRDTQASLADGVGLDKERIVAHLDGV